jgi:hypothetical protein
MVRAKKELKFMHIIGDNSYYAGWGTLALINAGLAQGKNREAETGLYLEVI